MLIRQMVLDGIVRGDIDLQFRRWRRPTVRAGGTLRTRAGMLEITEVERTTLAELSPDDARRAGYATKAALVADLPE